MYFDISPEKNIIDSKYIDDLFSYDDMVELLKDVKDIKCKLKEFLKKNKYVKYADNGEEHMYLYPNNKFFKKFKTEENGIEFIKEVIIEFLKELDYEGSEDVVHYIDIYILKELEKPMVKIILI